MSNALVAALLKVAAEHRLKAESLRNLVEPEEHEGDWISTPFRHFAEWLRKDTIKQAEEQEGLAEVYEAFAHRIISEVAGQLIMRGLEKLTGSAELDIDPEVFRVVEPYATENWARTWLHFYRGMDLPGNGLRFTGFN